MHLYLKMKRNLFFIISLTLIFLLAACSQTPEPVDIDPSPLIPVILDTDMAHEDMFAALYLLQHPNVDLKAITVAGTGEAHCAPGVRNALGLLALSGKPTLPVACGRELPLEGDHSFPESWRQAADNVYGVQLPENPNAPSSMTAPDLIADILRQSSQKVTLVAVGPLTNVGEALRDHPDVVENIAAIYIMGGAVEVGGNVGPSGVGIENDLAEWNIYIDPSAANLVLASGAPTVLVPLDATRDVPVTRSFYNSLGQSRQSAAANFVYDVLSTQLDFIAAGGFQFWDTFTSAVALQNDLASFEAVQIKVVEGEGPQSGWTQASAEGYPIQSAVSGEAKEFEALLIAVLNLTSP